MQNWLLQTLSDIFIHSEHCIVQEDQPDNISTISSCDTLQDYYQLSALKAQREWFSAIAALEKILFLTVKKN